MTSQVKAASAIVFCMGMFTALSVGAQPTNLQPLLVPQCVAALVESFVHDEDLPSVTDVAVFLTWSDFDLVFFEVEYGDEHDCEAGCFSSHAWGLARGCDKIGWLGFADYEGTNLDDLTQYDVESDETFLFEQALWDALLQSEDWFFRYGFLRHLADDPDVPSEVLERLQQ